jgi:hypothetical protein
MVGSTGPPAPHDQPPKRRSGCLLALYLLFGIGLFFLLAGGIAGYLFLKTEQGQQILETVKGGAQWITVAAQAPGTDELREAGCEAAMVSDAGSALDVFMTLVPDADQQAEIRERVEAEAGDEPLEDLTIVICTLPRLGDAGPGCDELARTYAAAVDDPPASFYVLLIRQGQQGASCQGIYSPAGSLLREPQLD